MPDRESLAPTPCLWLMRDPIALLFLTVQQLLVRL